MLIPSIPLLLFAIFGIWLNIKIFLALTFPYITLFLIYGALMDNHDYIEKLVNSEPKEKRIGPLGFILFVVGGFLQMISVIWQMAVN